MIDFHTHSIFSDGELIPSELVRRAFMMGYSAIAITDHVDVSNLDFIIPRLVRVCGQITRFSNIAALPGVELTHNPPELISELAREARGLGAKVVLVHGETMVEPVPEGTNRAAVESDIDILAHPGIIGLEEAKMAAEKDIYLELSGRSGHSFTNGHVARVATEVGARLIFNTDAHSPHDLMGDNMARDLILGSGLSQAQTMEVIKNSERLLKKITGRG